MLIFMDENIIREIQTDYRREEKVPYKDLTYWRENEIKIKEEGYPSEFRVVAF